MAHRVVNLYAYGSDETAISGHKDAIRNELDGYADNLHDYQCNDGQDDEDNYTLGVDADFTEPTPANTFHDWLKQYVQENASDFAHAETRIHDCRHASDLNEPCKQGDTWKLS